jgi:hypothetical protein
MLGMIEQSGATVVIEPRRLAAVRVPAYDEEKTRANTWSSDSDFFDLFTPRNLCPAF